MSLDVCVIAPRLWRIERRFVRRPLLGPSRPQTQPPSAPALYTRIRKLVNILHRAPEYDLPCSYSSSLTILPPGQHSTTSHISRKFTRDGRALASIKKTKRTYIIKSNSFSPTISVSTELPSSNGQNSPFRILCSKNTVAA